MFTEGLRRSYMQEAACLAMVLLDVEANIPEEILPVSWVNFRQAWLYETANAKTIKEVAHALLNLEDGVQILNDRRTQSLKDHAAWRKTVAGIHTYDLLAKYVKLFKLDVQQIMMNSFSNQSTRGIHNDHGLEKRKYFPETQSNQPHTTDGNVHSSFRPLDTDINSGQRETRPVALEVLPLSSKCPDKEIVPESIYLIGQEFLPPDAPATLKFMRAVLVAEKTRFNVTVKFPGMTSLQSYFGRAPEPANDQVRGTTKLSLVLQDQAKKETCMGTKPHLDGHYNMTPKLAERVLIRRVSCTEYLHQGHLWSFWIMEDFEQAESKRFSCDKETTDDDLEDDAKGEIGAAEALTQLIPGNAMIVTPEGNRAVNERSGKFCTEGPLRSQIKWGIRSLRRASFGNRSGSGSSPNSCDTGTKDANKDTRKTFSRKTLDFLDEQHQNIGQTTKSSDFLLSERSGRTHSRREEKLIDLVAVKCPDTSGKCVNSKHIRSNTILKLPKDMKGRWASERYKSAQLKLIEIMHKRGAVPGKPILRPALREEARKDIGDTGLLDHLLKHMTDTVVTNGERFRRRHNAEGAMEYWLEDASLMEIRKAAGIEDPSWIPPSGWKPGDALPGRGECGYGCLNRRMTPVEAAEMKKLKEMVDKVRSDLRSLNSRVRRWRSREVTPELKEGLRDDKHDTSTEIDQALIQSNSEFQEERRNEVELHGDLILIDVRLLVISKSELDHQELEFLKILDRVNFEEPLIKSGTAHVRSNARASTILRELRLEAYQSAPLRNLPEEDGTSTCKILTVQAKSQLETDLSEVQSSVVLMQEYIKCTMEGLGLSQEEDIKRTSHEVNSTDVMNACPFSAPDPTWAPVVGPLGIDLDSRSVLAKTSASAEINLRICSEESGRSTHKEVDFASSVGNEPKRPRLLQSSSGHNSAPPNGFKACQPSASGRIVQPEMIVPHTRARDSYAELERKLDTMVPDNLLAFLANTSSCLGHKAETSREDASARVIQSITGSDNKSQFRPYFQHRINFFLPSTDTEVDRDNQNTVYPDQRPEGNRVKWATGSEGRDFQATEFHQSNFQSESRASSDVGLEAAQARDGLAILSFVADVEAIAKTSQEHAKAQDIQGVSQNQVSAIANLKGCSSSAAGPTRGHSPAVTIHPEIRKRRMLQQVDTDHLSMMSSVTCSGCDTGGDSPAQCDRRGSVKASAPVTNGPFDETRPKLIQNSTSRPEHPMLTAVSKDTPIVHMAKDLSINLSLTSHIPPGLGNNGSQCNSLRQSLRGSVAEPSSTLTLSRLPAANAGGIYGHAYTPHNPSEQLESLQQVVGHSQDQPRALSKKNLLKEVRSTMQKSFPEIVGEKCSTQSSINKARSSTWLGLAPPTSSNSHS